MEFIYIAADPTRAKLAQTAGIDRVMVDLEIIGKLERQGGLDTVISVHTLEDVRSVRSVLRETALMVRVNPMYAGSRDEIDACIDFGADILMLPMFTTAKEVEQFISMVDGRARSCLLLETGEALGRANDILDVAGVEEVHIGLNDLHLALKLSFMFELLSGGLVEYLAHAVRSRNIKFGFGGVARLNRGQLRSSLILSEHVRLGSTQVLLSRDFNQVFEDSSDEHGAVRFCEEVRRLREFLAQLSHSASEEQLNANSAKLKRTVRMLVEGSPVF